MKRSVNTRLVAASALIAFRVAMWLAAPANAQSTTLAPQTLPHDGAIDERFQAYNIEMVKHRGRYFTVRAVSASDPIYGSAGKNEPITSKASA